MLGQAKRVFRAVAGAGLSLLSVAAGVSAQEATLTRVTLSTSGDQARGPSYSASLNGSGTIVAFDSDAANLVDSDRNSSSDVFIRNVRRGETRRVSVGTNGGSFDPSISEDARFIAFESEATSLMQRDGNGAADIFLRDRKGRVTRLISKGGSGRADAGSYEPSISDDASVVAFSSYASNLVADTNGDADIFVRNLGARRTWRVSVSSSGRQANEGSYSPSASSDGRFIAFDSLASNLVGRDANEASDVFVHDLRNKTTRRISVGAGGAEANDNSFDPVVSDDGRVIAFWSKASNLTAEDTNNSADVFVRDLRTGITERVSVGVRQDGGSLQPTISGDGRVVAFFSFRQLLPEDTNDDADIYVYDRATRVLDLASSSGGSAADGPSFRPALSGDGSAVAFHSFATNLVEGDTNAQPDVFLRLLQ